MDMDSRFLLMQLAGPLVVFSTMMTVAMVFAPVVLYVVARWRAHRDPVQDTQVGIKFIAHYFAILGFHLALAGGTLLVYTMIKPGGEDDGGKGELYRIAFGLLVPAGLVLGAHLALLQRTNDAQFPSVRRLFLGFNLLLTGLVGLVSLVFGFQALFAKGSTHGMGHLGGAMVLVYCAAWAVLAWRFDQLVLSRFSGLGGPPGNIVTQHVAPPPVAAASGTGLPPLGGGSFPPLDPR
jgi:hypothetical protein